MTATLTTRLNVPPLGNDVEIEVDYTYNQRHQELVIHGAAAVISGKQLPVWHLLTQHQRRMVEDDCRTDYVDRMEQVMETKWEMRGG